MPSKSYKIRTNASRRDWQQLGRIPTQDHKSQSQWSVFRGIALSTTVGIVAYFLYYGFLETRINTPLSVPKVSGQIFS